LGGENVSVTREPTGQIVVVRIQKGQEAGGGDLRAEVAAGARPVVAPVGMLDKADATGMSGRQLAPHLQRIVGRAVLDQDHFAHLGLRQNRLDAAPQETPRLEHGDDDRYVESVRAGRRRGVGTGRHLALDEGSTTRLNEPIEPYSIWLRDTR